MEQLYMPKQNTKQNQTSMNIEHPNKAVDELNETYQLIYFMIDVLLFVYLPPYSIP